MHKINQPLPSKEFTQTWKSAIQHIQKIAGKTNLIWLWKDLYPPFTVHLSFRIGNQLFLVFIETEEMRFNNSKTLFLNITNDANAIPCLMPIIKNGDEYKPELDGWGFKNPITNERVNPLSHVSEQPIIMTNWEHYNFAVDIVKDDLRKDGKIVTSVNVDSRLCPSLWFKDGNDMAWVIIKTIKYPEREAHKPENLELLIKKLSPHGNGYFASVELPQK